MVPGMSPCMKKVVLGGAWCVCFLVLLIQVRVLDIDRAAPYMLGVPCCLNCCQSRVWVGLFCLLVSYCPAALPPSG